MAKKRDSTKKNNGLDKYKDILLMDGDISNSILVVNNKMNIYLKNLGKLYLYYVVTPVNLPLKSRKAYLIKESRQIDFSDAELKKEINQIYNFDNNDLFCFLEPKDIVNKISKWFTNRKFPSVEEITSERICIKNTYGKGSKIPALFDFVRNCLCHGNFEIRKIGNINYLILEDCESSVIRGRGTIKIKTLIDIAECIIK
ncbi:MAG: hypothetical protein SOY33_03555 [Candidatus Onthovivens sp.]|nr:hypothetical protein [Bacilli bacterium]